MEVTPVSYDELSSTTRGSESSADIAARVTIARQMQAKRFEGLNSIYCNAQMPSRMVREVCQINQAGQVLAKKASSDGDGGDSFQAFELRGVGRVDGRYCN